MLQDANLVHAYRAIAFTALLNPVKVENWVTATLLSFFYFGSEYETVRTIKCSFYYNGYTFVNHLYNFCEDTTNSKLLTTISKLVESVIKPRHSAPYVLRFHLDDGTYHEDLI